MKLTTTSQTRLKPTNRTGESSSELQEEIRRRAYDLYEERGRIDGYEWDDWLQAETELVSRKSAAS